MATAIKIENLSKQYRLGEVGTGTLSHDLHRVWAKLRGKPDPFAKVGGDNNREQAGGEYVWALKDVSFEVQQGEILGIIGRNGAGKSTLLKMLSRVTAPTAGKIKTKGRIASLLEVGTGFHPELTGRENIYLNGAIMGMTRTEINKRLDEIVEFSGCAKYIDTPVKRYSSGMTVRLGFAVAAHLDCETLVVDEVLAVGDADFQKKCIGKMQDVATNGGRTVLFVSHQLNMVSLLCERVCILGAGSITSMGQTADIVAEYVQAGFDLNCEYKRLDAKVDNPYFSTIRLAIVDQDLNPLTQSVENNSTVGVVIEGYVTDTNPATKVGFALYGADGQLLFWSLSTDQPSTEWPKLYPGLNSLVCWLPVSLLNNGSYHVHLVAAIHKTVWLAQPLVDAPSVSFQIDGALSDSPLWQDTRPGLFAPALTFKNTESWK